MVYLADYLQHAAGPTRNPADHRDRRDLWRSVPDMAGTHYQNNCRPADTLVSVDDTRRIMIPSPFHRLFFYRSSSQTRRCGYCCDEKYILVYYFNILTRLRIAVTFEIVISSAIQLGYNRRCSKIYIAKN